MLRIEDTDRERSTGENVEQILDALRWLELDWDEGPLSQHERADRHGERLRELLDADKAYHSLATAETVKAQKAQSNLGFRGEPVAPGTEGAAVRLRVPEGTTIVHDEIRGDISFDNSVHDDPVIARGDGSVLYNFAVAIDDLDMGITDVVRGDDHLSNTPKQVIVMEQLGETPPRYAHLPLLHGPDGKKLSKRHGAASVQELASAGYLPAAVRNYLALLGWGAADDQTLLSTDELVRQFSIERVGRSSAIFDEKKLRWINGRYMRELPLEEYERRFAEQLSRADPAAAEAFAAGDAERRRAALQIAQEKAQTLDDVWPLVRFLFEDPPNDEKAWRKVMKDGTRPLLEDAAAALREADPFEPASIEASLAPILAARGVKPGQLYQPIRVAISGGAVSPGIFESLAVLGRDSAVSRIDRAVTRLR